MSVNRSHFKNRYLHSLCRQIIKQVLGPQPPLKCDKKTKQRRGPQTSRLEQNGAEKERGDDSDDKTESAADTKKFSWHGPILRPSPAWWISARFLLYGLGLLITPTAPAKRPLNHTLDALLLHDVQIWHTWQDCVRERDPIVEELFLNRYQPSAVTTCIAD